jgi:predicted small metal-binding protein
MMAVRCPACSERVEGSSSKDLSSSIKSHFAEVHNMDIDVEMNTSDEGCGCGSETSSTGGASSSSGQSKEEFRGGADAMREGPSSSGGLGNPEERAPSRKPSRPAPERGIGPGAKVDYKEKSFEVGGTGASTGMGEFESGTVTPEGTGASEDTRGISGFECPVCREEISGSSEEEMSSRFREHLTTTHKDEPFVTRLMETVGSR